MKKRLLYISTIIAVLVIVSISVKDSIFELSKVDVKLANNNSEVYIVNEQDDMQINDKIIEKKNDEFVENREIILEKNNDTKNINNKDNGEKDNSSNKEIISEKKKIDVVIVDKNDVQEDSKIIDEKVIVSDSEIANEKIIDIKTEDNTFDGEKIKIEKTIILIDESKGACAQAIEYFYTDEEYKYYFTCIKSHDMYVLVNGKKYSLVEALNNKIVTMQELNNAGYNFKKEKRNLVTK